METQQEIIYGVDIRAIISDNRLTYAQKTLMAQLVFLLNNAEWKGKDRALTTKEICDLTGISEGEICGDIPVLMNAGYIRAEKKKRLINGRPRGHEVWHFRIHEEVQLWTKQKRPRQPRPAHTNGHTPPPAPKGGSEIIYW